MGTAQQPDHTPPMLPPPHAVPEMVPHGAPGGSQAGGMDSKLPFKQLTGKESIESYMRDIQTDAPQYGQAQAQAHSQAQAQQDPAAVQAAQIRRQQMFQAQTAAAEARMRGIAQQENRLQAVGFVAIGMCVVFIAIFFMQMRGHVNFS